jgi:hypothetical protein
VRIARRTALFIAVVGFGAALVLALTPLSYTSPGGPQKDVPFAVAQKVACGVALLPRNPPPPPGTDDQCDAEHTKRWMLLSVPALGAAIAAGATTIAMRRRITPAQP